VVRYLTTKAKQRRGAIRAVLVLNIENLKKKEFLPRRAQFLGRKKKYFA